MGKQTDYDKALKEDKAAFVRAKGGLTQNEEAIFDGAFLSGYRFGYYQQMETVKKARQAAFNNYERNPNPPISVGLDHFRDFTKMMQYEIAMRAMQQLIQKLPHGKDYQRVAQIALNYADALIKELEKAPSNE